MALVEYMDDEFDAVDFDDDEELLFGRDRGGLDSDSENDDDMVSCEFLFKEKDTTAGQARNGKDIQGIPWGLQFTREKYREARLQQYKNYENLEHSREDLDKECREFQKGRRFYDFRLNKRSLKSTIVHFQLRNLIWATSKHDVYLMQNFCVLHWSPVSQKVSQVLNVNSPPPPEVRSRTSFASSYSQGIGRVQISTMCVRENLLVAGGFQGEMVCKNLDQPGVSYCAKITHDENAITNAIEIYNSPSGPTRLMTSNNDAVVRVFDAETFAVLGRFCYCWPVNHTSVSPDCRSIVVVGDNTEGLLADASSGKVIATLKGHLDYSFASAWHPDGRIFATGNQDTTCRLWDVRNLSSSLAILKGRLGAIRSLRFTEDGRFMAMAEPADFVHVFDTRQDFMQSQEIDLFGEIAGISFSPDTEALYIGVADRIYGSLLEYNRCRENWYLDSFV
ncbi:hypothetical protein SELMODRAFT_112794 [Selaginella moellendorffii]|uniref:DUF2415 domain-containing protein n=1 Tax=Selaginella moellendorffii TaxID=88036 RepID=D8SBD5_SELML|nr:hypothetical protein SELMODRAFT_112794 [Selaginella moellendorffii]